MKKLVGILCIISIFAIGCAMLGDPKKMACQAGCDSNYESCKEEAKDDAKAIAACEAKKIACYKGCDEL